MNAAKLLSLQCPNTTKWFICQIPTNGDQKNFCGERLNLEQAIARSLYTVMGVRALQMGVLGNLQYKNPILSDFKSFTIVAYSLQRRNSVLLLQLFSIIFVEIFG